MSSPWLLAALLAGQQMTFEGTVTHVHDGDTAHVTKADGAVVKVRFVFCDAPEIGQPGGEEAREFVRELCLDRPVTVVSHGPDDFGRTLGEILLGGESVNKAVIRNGHGWWFYHYHPEPELGQLEVEARAAKKGLFAQEAPIYPRAWRRGARLGSGQGAGGSDGAGAGSGSTGGDGPVLIMALLADPDGEDTGHETAILGNGSAADVSIDRWQLADDDGGSFPLSGFVPAGGSLTVRLSGSLQLGNRGDTVLLKNARGEQVQSVSYGSARRGRFFVVAP